MFLDFSLIRLSSDSLAGSQRTCGALQAGRQKPGGKSCSKWLNKHDANNKTSLSFYCLVFISVLLFLCGSDLICLILRETAPTLCVCCSLSIRLMFTPVVPAPSIHSARTCSWATTKRWAAPQSASTDERPGTKRLQMVCCNCVRRRGGLSHGPSIIDRNQFYTSVRCRFCCVKLHILLWQNLFKVETKKQLHLYHSAAFLFNQGGETLGIYDQLTQQNTHWQ